VYALRMLGVFMILPIFEIYAKNLPQHPGQFAIQFAMTAAAMMQAVLQIPLGRLSDRIGRKPVIAMGMLVFALGSYIAGLSDRIELIALGRALQGVGAISSAVTALLADVTRAEVRTIAMAIMGAGMGVAFVAALVLGPIAEGLLGVSGIFRMTAVLALLSLPLIWWSAPGKETHARSSTISIGTVLADGDLLRLSLGILLLHATIICIFTGAPLLIQADFGLASEQHWKIYLPILLGTLLFALPLMRRADRGAERNLLVGAVATLIVGLLVAGLVPGGTGLIVGLSLFFLAFNLLEGLLPSVVSRRVPAEHKGAALGVYATAQFLGQPVGGFLGGWTMSHYGPAAALAAASALPVLWLTFAHRLRPTANAQTQH
jgi:MFS family permease